ncbi:hypothetical protein FG379_001351, partial [Cryptosporidium bovis]|uniref:uncharacterized protein n=1 Tax=Cryptosporidium bovis TaxID=310047 RepID=UPI00351AA161
MFIFKSVELDYLSKLNESEINNGIRKVEFIGEKICIIEETSLSVFELSNIDNPKQTFRWRTKINDEYILAGIWVWRDLFLVASNVSLYLFEFNEKPSIIEFVIPFFSGKNITNVDIICINENLNDNNSLLFALCFCSGLSLVSINKNYSNINFGKLVENIRAGKLLCIEQNLYFTDGNLLNKYSLDIVNLECKLMDSINICEIFHGSIVNNCKLFTALKFSIISLGCSEDTRLIITLSINEKKNSKFELTISNTSLLPINISEISLNDNLVDLSIISINSFKTYFATYKDKLSLRNILESEDNVNLIAFSDFVLNFKPFVSNNIKNSNIVYICCGKNVKKGKWYLNFVEYDKHFALAKEFNDPNYNSLDTVSKKDKSKLKTQLDMLLNSRNKSLVPLNYILNFLNYFILISDENDHSYVVEYITNISFSDYNEAREFYFNLFQNFEKSNQNLNIVSILNNLIHKLVTFNYIYSKNERNTELAINICNSEPLRFPEDRSISKWNRMWKNFVKCDIWKLGICFLLLNSVSEFFILFNRHSFQYGNSDEKIRNDLVLESLENIPIIIPDEFEKKLPSWLVNQVFPLVVDRDRLLNWLANRAIALEYITDGDINRCIFLLSSIFQSDIQFPVDSQSLPRQIVTNGILWAGSGDKRYYIKKSSSNKINKIHFSFLECLDIRENYNLNVGFNPLFHGKISSKEIAFTLLIRVKKLELLREEIEKNVIPFCRQRGIDSDLILLEYILDMSSIIQSRTYDNEENDDKFEIKVNFLSSIITLIDSISKDEYKSDALLQYFSVFNKYGSLLKSNKTETELLLLKNNFEYLLNCAKNLKLDERKALELKNRISLIDAQNLLSRYNLDHMASVVLFEKNAPRRLLVHIISQVSIGIESFKDALSLLSYLERETGAFIMSITEACCLRLRFITFGKSLIQKINGSSGNCDIMSLTKNLELEILDLLSILDFEKRYGVTQQFTCFIWQFLDSFSLGYNSGIFKVKCRLAVFSAIVVLREFLKFIQKNDIKLRQVTFWASNESFNTLLRLQTLQVEFEIFLRPSDIMINKINHDQESPIEVNYAIVNVVPASIFDDTGSYSSKISTNHGHPNLKDWEWDSDYYHLYNESCYSRICEIFDQYSKPFIENNEIREKKRGKLTRLLRLGGLIGVDESYVRRTLIRHSITAGNKLSIFKRLTQELVKSPSPKNAMIIIDEVQNIILYLNSVSSGEFQPNPDYTENQISEIDPFELSFIITELLQILACCIPFCPTSVISFVLSLSGDIFWVYDFLIQASDIIDSVEYTEYSFLITQEAEHVFTKLLINSFQRNNGKSVHINLRESYYKEICTLYPSDNAIIMALKFLANKITLRKELSRHISLKRAYVSSLLSVNFCVDPGWWPINYESDMNQSVYNIFESFKKYINTFLQQLYQLECLSLSTSLYLRHPMIITDLSLLLNINVDFFRKVLKGKDPMDGQLCMALSSSLEKRDSWNVFVQSLTPSNILDNYYRAQRMARIGWDLGILYNHYSMRKEMEDLYTQSKWCNFFRQVHIDFDQSLFFQKQDPKNNIHSEYKKNILQKIIFKNEFDLVSCLQYARDYNINDEYVIKLWTEKMILYFNGFRFERKMLNILNIVTPELGKEIFNNSFNYISSYNYERLFFILNWYYEKSRELSIKSVSEVKYLEKIHSTCSSNTLVGEKILLHEASIKSKLEIVKILMTHKRVCGPDHEEKEFIDKEVEELRERNQENWDEEITINLFSRQKYRIPFHYLFKFPLKVLKYEINDETIYKIKLLSQHLGINKVVIDIQFVWNIVSCRKYRYYKDNNDFAEIEKYSKEFDHYYSNLIEDDKILLRYIESIGSFDLEAGIAIILLIIDELPLSITKIKLIEWYETKEDKYPSIALEKGYPLTKTEGINYSRQNEVISNTGDFLRSRKSLISTMLILEKHKLNTIFSNLLEITNDISHFIFTLYYYLIPLISEGFHRKNHNINQKLILQTFCSNFEEISPTCLDKCSIKIENAILNSRLVSRFNIFIDEILNSYSIETKKIRTSMIKNMLNKPFETPYEVVKNKFSNKVKVIFDKIGSLLIPGLDHWYVREESSFPNFYNKFFIDRIAFICEGINPSDSILLLLSISFRNTTNYSFSTKCNALKTLFQIASTKSIQKKYPKYNDLKVIWLHNYYMIFFHELHIPQDFSKFYLSEKVGLARSLWREYENRKLNDSVYVKAKNEFCSEESRLFVALKENESKNKIRCIQNQAEAEPLQFRSSRKLLSSNMDKNKQLNNILYLIAEMCIDFGINDSRLFSNTVLNLYGQSFDENDVKSLRNILFASYKSGFIFFLPLKKILIDTWSFLLTNPIKTIQIFVDDFLNNFWRTDFYEDKISEISTLDLKLLLKTPIHHHFVTFFSYICNECPITPFINIDEYIDAFTNLCNSIFDLMTSTHPKNNSNKINNGALSLIDFTVTFFTTFSDELVLYEQNMFNKKILNEFKCEDIMKILETLLYRLTSLIIRPIDLHIDIYSPEKNKIVDRIAKNLKSHELYPYLVYTSSSNFLISSLSLEFINISTPNNFFEIGDRLIGFIDESKKKHVENLFLMSCISARRIYEYIEYKNVEYEIKDYILIINKCIKHYGIDSVIPYIIKLLSGETNSEGEILERLRLLESQSNNKYG